MTIIQTQKKNKHTVCIDNESERFSLMLIRECVYIWQWLSTEISFNCLLLGTKEAPNDGFFVNIKFSNQAILLSASFYQRETK